MMERSQYFKETEEGVASMCEAFEEVREEGIKEGIEIGKIKGRQEGLKEGRQEGRQTGRKEKYARSLPCIKSPEQAAGNVSGFIRQAHSG